MEEQVQEVTTEQQQVEESNLPSDVDNRISFEVNPEDLQDGKFGGKWESPKQMADHIKEMEDKYANLQRDVTNKNKQTDAEIAEVAKQVQVEQELADIENKITNEFLDGGITEETKQAALDAGISEEGIENRGYKAKASLDAIVAHVGSIEVYNDMIETLSSTLTDTEKSEFNSMIKTKAGSEIALLGLEAKYNMIKNGGNVQPQDRIRGNPASNNAIKPYESKQELLRDKKYADSRVASAADKARFKARFRVTPDDVWLS